LEEDDEMKELSNPLWTALAALLALSMAVPAAAQQFTGRIEVTVVDSTGAVLPGATLELTGPRSQTEISDANGVARFLNLGPGIYQVKAVLTGFGDYVNNNVPVVAGGNVQLRASLVVGGVAAQIEVTAESPVIDAKKTGTGTNVTLDELQNIPSARDPWVVMQTVPGIITDRVNVGGSESGQQSGYQAKGASGADATWNMDGIPITDMAATGATPTYYDFDMFQEMAVTTGGSDMSMATGGVGLNFVLKSGTNQYRGSSRIYYEDESMQSNNMSPELARNLGSPNGKGNRTAKYADYGFEVGGPIVKDRLWAWGALGKTDVRILTIRQTPDNTILKNRALKIQGQASPALRGSFTYFYGNKLKYGRDASATRPPETTYNQSGPSSFYKGEMNFVVGDSLFLTARGSHFPTGFGFEPQGGMNKDVYNDDEGVWHGSYWNYLSDRPQQTLMGEGSLFRGKHEIKFGYSWRRVTVTSTSQLSSAQGNSIVTYHIGYPDFYVGVASPWMSANRAFYNSAWVGDTISMKRATITAGLRYDHQTDSVLESSEPAVPGFEKWLPAIQGPAVKNAIVWKSVSPRVGLSYALDEARKTLVRGSYAMFSSQLPNGRSAIVGVVQYRYIAFYGRDLNGDKVAQPNEITSDIDTWTGFDINNPSALKSVNQVGDYHVPKTHEVILGFDREIVKNFGVSTSFTWRKFVDFNWTPRIGVRANDYVLAGTLNAGPLPDGSNVSVPYYKVDPTGLEAGALAGGLEFTGRDGYHQRFWGVEVQATKRLANKWMARFAFSTNDHRQYWDDPVASIQDPTPSRTDNYKSGSMVVVASGGSGKSGIYQLLPKYQFIANGLYQAPWGIDLGANLVMRQGFGQAWFQDRVPTGDFFGSNKTVGLWDDINKNRLPTVTSLDVRLGKLFKYKRVGMNIDLDVFNLFNTGTELGRQYNYRLTGATGFNQVLEIMNPRIARVGLRVNF
jgi:hypothetical protein